MNTTKLWLDRHDPAHVHHEPLDEEIARLRAERDELRVVAEMAHVQLRRAAYHAKNELLAADFNHAADHLGAALRQSKGGE